MKAHEILKEHFERKKRAGYSLRALARDLGVSPAFVSNVFAAKKKVPLKLAEKLVRILDIDKETALEIRRQLLPPDDKSSSVYKSPASSTNWKVTSKKGLSALKQWYYLAAMECTLLEDYDGSAEYISRRLEVPLPSIRVALKDLVSLGLLIEKDGRVQKPSRRLRFSSSESQQEIRNFHRQMLRRADEELGNSSPEAFEKRLITGLTITADPARLAVAKKMLSDSLHEIANYLSSSSPGEVYHLSAQLVPLTKKP